MKTENKETGMGKITTKILKLFIFMRNGKLKKKKLQSIFSWLLFIPLTLNFCNEAF